MHTSQGIFLIFLTSRYQSSHGSIIRHLLHLYSLIYHHLNFRIICPSATCHLCLDVQLARQKELVLFILFLYLFHNSKWELHPSSNSGHKTLASSSPIFLLHYVSKPSASFVFSTFKIFPECNSFSLLTVTALVRDYCLPRLLHLSASSLTSPWQSE